VGGKLEMMKSLFWGVLAGALLFSACTGGGSSAAKPSPAVSAGGGAAKPSAQAAAPIPSAQVVGQRAPGPFSPNGAVTVSNGQASIEGTDSLKWQPDVILAKPGEQVTLQVANKGNTVHNFLSPALNVSPTDTPIQKTTEIRFSTPSQPGAYMFWCNIPGHAEAGMVGEVIVQ